MRNLVGFVTAFLIAGLLAFGPMRALAQDGKEEKPGDSGAAKPAAKFERKALGLVWRDLDSALQEAKKTGKPIFCSRTLGDLFGGDL